MATRTTFGGGGRVEQPLHGRQDVPLLHQVEAPAIGKNIRGRPARAAHFFFEQSGDGKHRVPQRFAFEPTRFPTPEMAVVRIDSRVAGLV